MAGEAHRPDHTPTAPRSGYVPGWLMLAGLVVGALAGTFAGPLNAVPVGMVAGLAVGVALESIINHRINGPFEDPVAADDGVAKGSENGD